jgi:hypothetical protein
MAQSISDDLNSNSNKSSNSIPRHRVEYEGKLIYSWDQDIEQVNIFITPPPNITAKMIEINYINNNHIQIGIKNSSQLFIDEDLGGQIIVSNSYWTLADGELSIQLQKQAVGETW